MTNMDGDKRLWWTNENKAIVRDLWVQGYSAGVIGGRLGKTRMAIIGLVRRMGLVRVERASNPEPAATTMDKHGSRGQGGRFVRRDGSFTPKTGLQPLFFEMKAPTMPDATLRVRVPGGAAETSFRPEGKVSLVDLPTNGCHWPIGDPRHEDFGYCGASVYGDGTSYCPIHNKIAYTPARR